MTVMDGSLEIIFNIKILLFPRRGVGTVAASASLPGRLCAGLSLEDGVQLV